MMNADNVNIKIIKNSCKGDPPAAEPSEAKRTKEMKLGPKTGTKP